MRALAALALAMVAGCSASLRGDGFYACPDGQCPSGFTCGTDMVCHVGPGTDGGAPIDMGAPVDMGETIDTGMMSTQCSPRCSGTQDCVVGAWTTPMPSYACAVMSQIITTNHGMVCTPGPFCMAPDVCIPGSSTSRCMRPCGMTGVDHCGFGEDCVMHGGMGGACLHPCIAGACPSGGAICSGGYCMPPNW